MMARDGAKVVAAARRLDRLEALKAEVAEAGYAGCILPVQTDVRDPAQIDNMFDVALKEFGHVDMRPTSVLFTWVASGPSRFSLSRVPRQIS